MKKVTTISAYDACIDREIQKSTSSFYIPLKFQLTRTDMEQGSSQIANEMHGFCRRRKQKSVVTVVLVSSLQALSISISTSTKTQHQPKE